MYMEQGWAPPSAAPLLMNVIKLTTLAVMTNRKTLDKAMPSV